MRKTYLWTAVVAAVSVVGLPATASADPHTRCDSKRLKESYSAHYFRVAKKFGTRTPGRNIRRYGLTNGRKSTCAQLARSNRTFQRWLAPPPAPVHHSDRVPVKTVASKPEYAGGRYSIPSYIVQCESGGNYSARNPSGAYGAYQIMPGTAAAYGCSLATPAGQDACAARIYAAEGASPWECG